MCTMETTKINLQIVCCFCYKPLGKYSKLWNSSNIKTMQMLRNYTDLSSVLSKDTYNVLQVKSKDYVQKM